MPSCVGPPSGTCKNKSKPKVVKFGQGELWLCEECEEIRFGHLNGRFTKRVALRIQRSPLLEENRQTQQLMDQTVVPCATPGIVMQKLHRRILAQ